MNPEFAIELLKNTMFQALALAAPFLITAMVVGLAISLFQAVTTIHEQTLAFVPKLVVVLVVLVAMGPVLGSSLVRFTQAMLLAIPSLR